MILIKDIIENKYKKNILFNKLDYVNYLITTNNIYLFKKYNNRNYNINFLNDLNKLK